jgi:hypothetical protein
MATEGLAGVREESPVLGKDSPELGKMTEATSESSNPPHHGVELDEINSMVVSVCTRIHGFAGKARRKVCQTLVDAKVRQGFLRARVIELG